MTNEELKACPFCGCKAYLQNLDNLFTVCCDTEDCFGYEHEHNYFLAEDAIEAWNTRAQSAVDLEAAIHYPECWDTAAYPTVESALAELCAFFKCSNADCAQGHIALAGGEGELSYFHLCNGYPHNDQVRDALKTIDFNLLGKHGAMVRDILDRYLREPQPSGDAKAEANKAYLSTIFDLMGTMKYIETQARLNHPCALKVIEMNAQNALRKCKEQGDRAALTDPAKPITAAINEVLDDARYSVPDNDYELGFIEGIDEAKSRIAAKLKEMGVE